MSDSEFSSQKKDAHLSVGEGGFWVGVVIPQHLFVGREGFSGQRKPAGRDAGSSRLEIRLEHTPRER